MRIASRILFPLSVVILLLAFVKPAQKVRIISIGDSTMADAVTADDYPGRGWMQMTRPYYAQEVEIFNFARSGRSSKSFRTEGHWEKALKQIGPGDYVFIQFGHNDQKPDTARHTDPETTFKANLIRYVEETKARKAFPILFTSIVRREFGKDGKLKDTHGAYVTVVRALADSLAIPLVDMTRLTGQLVEQLGVEDSKKLYLYVQPGVTPKLPEGKKDDTHLCVYGADQYARLAAESIKTLSIPLSQYVINTNTAGGK